MKTTYIFAAILIASAIGALLPTRLVKTLMLVLTGVLFMGTGSMTHNLGEFFGSGREPAPYVIAFSRWVEDKVSQGDLKSLLNYRELAPHAARAHPTDDHFLPLFFALGAAAEGARPDYLSREVRYSMLAMDALALQPA